MFSLMVIVLTLFPAALALFPLPKQKANGTTETPAIIDRFLGWIVHLDLHKQKITLPILGIFVVFCIIGIFRIRVETSPVEFFKKDTAVSRHFHDIYKDLSGSFPVNVVMASEDDDYFEDPDNLAEIAELQEFLETLPGVDKTVSFAEYLKLVNYASNQFDPKYYTLPEEGFEVRMLMNNYRIMLGEDMFTRFMNYYLSKANILLFTHISSSRDFLETREKIFAHVQENFSKDLTFDVTGLGMVVSASSHLLTKGQVRSLSLTVVLVFSIMFLLFLSSKVGLVAIVPNLFPIVINFGIMGWLGIELSMVTSLIASIAIGLAVDDTIHYLVRYNREFKKSLDDKLALTETIKHVGRPIVFTTLTIGICRPYPFQFQTHGHIWRHDGDHHAFGPGGRFDSAAITDVARGAGDRVGSLAATNRKRPPPWNSDLQWVVTYAGSLHSHGRSSQGIRGRRGSVSQGRSQRFYVCGSLRENGRGGPYL
jgi:predicted RND superfamily exporter protein